MARLLSYLPQNNMERAPRIACNDPIDRNNEVKPVVKEIVNLFK